MHFLESTHPSALSKSIQYYLNSKNIYLEEPLSALSSFSCIFIYFFYINYLNTNDFSLVFILFTTLSNQLASFMMHATFNNKMICSDIYTMHIGFMGRLLLLIMNLDNIPIIKYSLLFLLVIIANTIFIDVDIAITSIISLMLMLQLLFTPDLYCEIRLLSLFTLLGLAFQILSRETSNIFIQNMNKYIEFHVWWHYIINFLTIYYVYNFNIPLNKIDNNYTNYLLDITFYGVISIISVTISVYKYFINAKQLLYFTKYIE